MKSRLYEGWVLHRRFQPLLRDFRYRMFMVYLDLAELPALFDPFWLWSCRRPALAWFRREDHYGHADQPLDESIRDLVEVKSGFRPAGPIRLLTHLRYFGYCMNPVSFYYCFDREDHAVESVVAEIHNTPWGEQHCYVLDCRGEGERLTSTFDKSFHVSPFMSMNQQYQWRMTRPGREIAVHMKNLEEGAEMFEATLSLRSRAIDSAALRGVLLRYPLMTLQVLAAIYFQALCLWWRGLQFFSHPKHGPIDVGPEVIREGAKK